MSGIGQTNKQLVGTEFRTDDYKYNAATELSVKAVPPTMTSWSCASNNDQLPCITEFVNLIQFEKKRLEKWNWIIHAKRKSTNGNLIKYKKVLLRDRKRLTAHAIVPIPIRQVSCQWGVPPSSRSIHQVSCHIQEKTKDRFHIVLRWSLNFADDVEWRQHQTRNTEYAINFHAYSSKNSKTDSVWNNNVQVLIFSRFRLKINSNNAMITQLCSTVLKIKYVVKIRRSSLAQLASPRKFLIASAPARARAQAEMLVFFIPTTS